MEPSPLVFSAFLSSAVSSSRFSALLFASFWMSLTLALSTAVSVAMIFSISCTEARIGRGDMSCGAMDGTKDEIKAIKIGQKSEVERTKNRMKVTETE